MKTKLNKRGSGVEHIKEKLNYRGFGRIMGYMKPRMLPYLTGLIGSSIMDTITSVIMAFVLKYLVDATVEKNIQFLYSALGLVVLTILALCIGYPIFEYVFKSTIKKTVANIRLKLFAHIETVTISKIENLHSGEIISRMNNDLELLEKSYSDDLRNLIVNILYGLSSLAFMFTMDWRLSLALLVFGVVTLIVNRMFAVPLRNISKTIQEKTAGVIRILTDIFSGFQTVKSLNLKRLLLNKYESESDGLTKVTIKKARVSALLDGTNFLLEWFNFGGIMVIGSLMVITGQTTFGKLIAIIQLLNGVIYLFQNLGNYISQLQVSLVGAERVFELMDEAHEPERYNLRSIDSKAKAKAEIVFDNVSFTYENGVKALDNISFSIKKGSAAAIIGSSGSGKSTIMKILLGFYQPSDGGIAISGKDLQEYSLEQLRQMMAYVPQDSYLFDVSIRENIRYGKPDATDDEIMKAAQMAFAHDFIMEQPDGYNTLVGERGQSLSGGQKQRIAIARAFLKNAPILLLDEATSSLDTKSEDLVKQALEKLMTGRTTITIAHRLSTIDNADTVLELEHGAICS